MSMMVEEKLRLLIVEDDPKIRYLLETAAVRTGLFELLATLGDGQEALDWLQARGLDSLPEFIVTDLSMPRLTGLGLLRALKADPYLQAIPVGVITSSNVPNDREEAFAAGACGFVEKPHGLDALGKALTALRQSCAEAHAKRHHAV